MLSVYYTRIIDRPVGWWNERFRHLPTAIHARAGAMKNMKRRHNYLLGRLLIEKALASFSRTLHQINYSDKGRPCLEGGIDFNLSHSGDYIVCVASDTLRVGIDVEQKKLRAQSSMKAALSKDEWNAIGRSSDILNNFYQLWTQKEAVAKADGRGLRLLKSIRIEENRTSLGTRQWYLRELEIDSEYMVHLATNQYLDPCILHPAEFVME